MTYFRAGFLIFCMGCTLTALSLGHGERQTRDQVGLAIGATIIRLDDDTVDPPELSSAQGPPPHPGHVPGMTCVGVLDVLHSGPAPPAPEGPPDGPLTLSPDEMEGGGLGDRCPFPPDENGRYPEFCYDILDLSTGNCLLDDIVATKEMCIMMFNQTYYDHLVELQQEIEKNRSQAINDIRNSTGPAMDNSTITTNNISTNPGNEPVQLPANVVSGPDDRPDFVPGPMPAGLDDVTQAADSSPQGPRYSAVRREGGGPRFNLGALNSLDFMQHPPTDPPRKLIGHNK